MIDRRYLHDCRRRDKYKGLAYARLVQRAVHLISVYSRNSSCGEVVSSQNHKT